MKIGTNAIFGVNPLKKYVCDMIGLQCESAPAELEL